MIDLLKGRELALALTFVVALGNAGCTAASNETRPTAPASAESEIPASSVDLSDIFTPGAVGDTPLPIVDDGQVCEKEGTTQDGVSDAVYSLDAKAADEFFERASTATGWSASANVDSIEHAQLYHGTNADGDQISMQLGGVKGKQQVAYVDIIGTNTYSQLFLWNEANPPGGSIDPACAGAPAKWVVAVEFPEENSPAEGKSIDEQLKLFVERFGTAANSSFTQAG